MNVNRRDRILKPLASFVLRPVTGNSFFFSREREKERKGGKVGGSRGYLASENGNFWPGLLVNFFPTPL